MQSAQDKAPSPAPQKKAPVVLDLSAAFSNAQRPGKAKPVPSSGSSKNDRPWRKPAAAVKAEREASAKILGGPGAGGTHLDSVRLVMAVQELLDEKAEGSSDVQAACTELLQDATNARPPEQVQASASALHAALDATGLADAAAKRMLRPSSGATSKLQLLHEVMPRLWVGGWAALNDECAALRQRKVTHVVSVLSADQRKLPPFIQDHLYVRVDDTEEAAGTLAAHFEQIVTFIEAARAAGGVVFVHCGAGISRAPTSACAYVIWKLRMPAAGAIKLVRAARPCTRPNVGFVAALKAWEGKVLAGQSLADGQPRELTTPVAAASSA